MHPLALVVRWQTHSLFRNPTLVDPGVRLTILVKVRLKETVCSWMVSSTDVPWHLYLLWNATLKPKKIPSIEILTRVRSVFGIKSGAFQHRVSETWNVVWLITKEASSSAAVGNICVRVWGKISSQKRGAVGRRTVGTTSCLMSDRVMFYSRCLILF